MSRIFVIGLSHRTAPVDIREALSVDGEALQLQLKQAAELCGEALVLSTCNRYELYGRIADERALTRVEALIAARRPEAREHLYHLQGEAAVRHLFRVASSLDSMVLGEPQILGQVKQAYHAAQQAGTVGPVLSSVVPRAFQVAKRVRTDTAIGQSASSVASVAVALAGQVFGGLSGHPVLLVGAGKMAELCARHLREASADQFLVVNRTRSRAEDLAGRLSGTAHEWSELEALLGRAAVVLCSTGAREPVLRLELLQRVMKARRGRWLLLIDIAVPRDIDPKIAALENVYLYDIDALQAVVSDNLSERQREATAAEQIVEAEIMRLGAREREGDVVPLIRALRAHALGLAQAEVGRVLPRLGPLGDRERRLVEGLAEGIVNKLLHAPLTALKRSATGGDPASGRIGDLAEAVRRLWPLEQAASEAPALAGDGAPARADADGDSGPTSALSGAVRRALPQGAAKREPVS
ncbi:MAG: glutamyl-tRNA reductase [Polyangia bacterium]